MQNHTKPIMSQTYIYMKCTSYKNVCLCSNNWTVWPMTMIVGTYVGRPLSGLGWVVCQRSRSNAKKRIWTSLFVDTFFEVGQESKFRGPRSRSNVWCVVVDIRGSAHQVQQRAIALKFGATDDCYQSNEDQWMSVSVLRVFANSKSASNISKRNWYKRWNNSSLI